MTILESALAYAKKGYSIIPVLQNKKPLIKWEPYQKKKASEEEIRRWLGKWPDANIGIVTGEISNLFVVDTDSPESSQRINDAIPDSLTVPCQHTPSGGMHFLFSHIPGFSNRAKVAHEIDIRTSGGYFVAAPSINGNGKGWEWVVSPLDADVPELIIAVKELISNSFSLYTEPIDDKSKLVNEVNEVNNILFFEGQRDDGIFHISNAMVKGSLEYDIALKSLQILGSHCDPPFPEKEVEEKLKSAIQRASRKERNITQELRDWVNESKSGQFQVKDYQRESMISKKEDKHTLIVSLRNLCNEGILERIGKRTGEYRIIEKDFTVQEWWDDEGEPLNIKFPLGVHDFVKIYPGNIILLEGQKSQGKSAFALEFCRLNRQLFKGKIRYQNVEMSDSELRERFVSYPSDIIQVPEWKESVEFIKRTSDWWDLIEPDSINIIDYLVEYEKAYLIAQFVFQIHQKLKTGIALIVVQRDPMKPYPSGGRAVRDIPRLIISLIHHVIKIEDVKSFRNTPFGNPTGLSRLYKQVNWWKFLGITDWSNDKPKDEKPERKSWVD